MENIVFKLPQEIIINVWSYLPYQECIKLRLVNTIFNDININNDKINILPFVLKIQKWYKNIYHCRQNKIKTIKIFMKNYPTRFLIRYLSSKNGIKIFNYLSNTKKYLSYGKSIFTQILYDVTD